MKKVTLTMMMMFAVLLTACSTDDQIVAVNDETVGSNEETVGLNEETADLNEQNVIVFTNPPVGNCADVTAIGGIATLSSYTGPQITFSWNNAVTYDVNKTYVSYIEISEDAACPAPAGAAAVAGTYPIDVFNTSSLVIPAGVSAKCFYWRIVVNGYSDLASDCTTTTEWMPATYVQ